MAFSLEQQLAVLSKQERGELRKALVLQQASGGGAITQGALGFGRGALAGLRGRSIDPVAKQGSILPKTNDLQTFEAKERIKAEVKKEFGAGAGGLQIVNLPGGGFAVVPGNIAQPGGVETIDVESKVSEEGKPLELEDITIKSGGITGKVPKTAEQREREAVEGGVKKGVEEAFKQAEGIKRALKKLGSITRQFSEALPTGNLHPFIQRIRGIFADIGAETGIAPNPKLLALKITAKLQLRAILRDMGEGARLSDQDITQNIAIIEQTNLTDEEREALIATYMQTAVDSMDFRTLRVLTDDPGVVQMFDGLGISLQDSASGELKVGGTFQGQKIISVERIE